MRFLNREQLLANAAEGLQDARADALAILERALDAVEPEMLVARSVAADRREQRLRVRGDPFAGGPASAEDLALPLPRGKVRCVAAGKGSVAMLRGLRQVFEPDEAFAAAPVREADAPFDVIEAGHPLPTQGSCEAGRRALAMARATGPDDLLIVLLSGGASALFEDPLVPLDDLRRFNEVMLAAGAGIEALNTVRKKLSGVKGGRLAAAAGGPVLTLMLSDCFEDHASTVGSGPGAPDPTTHGDALAILAQYGVEAQVPGSVLEVLREGKQGKRPETPKPGSRDLARATNVVLGSNALAAHEATQLATELGYHAFRVREPLREPAQRAGWKLARMAEDVTVGKAALPRPACIVFGGETTVDLRGARTLGVGGRNQECALAAMEALKVEATIACLGTDGVDGPTPAAGAILDMGSRERSDALGLDRRAHLARHDSHGFFARLGDDLRTGPTGTNVADLAVVLVPG